MKILITGARGFVGSKLMEKFPDAAAAPSLRDAGEKEVLAMMEAVQPDVILHTAAISDIGTCARDPEGSYRANVQLPLLLAKYSGGAKLVCFSSDQVYSGCEKAGPYTETDALPENLYASHKLEMENRVLECSPDSVMLRAEWMYDWISPRSNYLRRVLGGEALSFSSRQYRGVTWAQDVARVMESVMRMPGGVYNFGAETHQSMYDITRAFLQFMGRENAVSDCPPGHNLWMDCSKAAKYGVVFPDVLEGLKQCALAYDLL